MGVCRPYLTLMSEEAPQREHALREVFNGLRWIVRAGAPWRMLPNDLPPWEAVYQQTRALAERWGLRGAGQRLAPTFARGCRTQGAALGSHL